jgi:hypothetical protein
LVDRALRRAMFLVAAVLGNPSPEAGVFDHVWNPEEIYCVAVGVADFSLVDCHDGLFSRLSFRAWLISSPKLSHYRKMKRQNEAEC